jgi:hypothetical protein
MLIDLNLNPWIILNISYVRVRSKTQDKNDVSNFAAVAQLRVKQALIRFVEYVISPYINLIVLGKRISLISLSVYKRSIRVVLNNELRRYVNFVAFLTRSSAMNESS